MTGEAGGDGEEILFSEDHHYGAWFYIAMIALFTFFVVLIVLMARTGALLVPVAMGCVLLLLAVTYGFFGRLTFIITGSRVEFGFGRPFRKSFSRGAVKSCEEYELLFRNTMGYGIRFGMDGTTIFNTRNGRGVKIEFEGAKRPYVISVDDPAGICQILSTR